MNEEKQSVQVTVDNNPSPDTADKIKVSVIVPVYKDEKYIERCLYSLINQSLKEMEFIFIDDCGGDNSISIVEKEAASDNRIRIIYNKKNIGAGFSRNKGIESAHGEYLGFVDADDEVDLNFYEKIYALAVKYNSDVSKGQRINYLLNGTKQKGLLTDSLSEFGEYAERQDWFYYFDFEHQTAIYRRDLIKKENIRYSNTLVAQDTMFLLQMMYYAHKVAFCHDAYYHYYIREDSLSTTRSASFYEANIQNFDERIKFLCNHPAEKDVVIQYVQGRVDYLLTLYQSIAGADNNRIRYNYLCGMQNALDHFIYKDQLFERFNKITEYKKALIQVQSRRNRKMRKNWALVTGAVRSDLYLRVIIVKLCDMRDKGQIEGIVFSTWKGEVDAFPGLRDELIKCGVILVETPYINEEAENKFNQLIYARQNMQIDRGLNVIPDDCFVIKLRTDFLTGFQKFLDCIFGETFDDTIKTYGAFPRFYKNKMTLENYNSKHIIHSNDRYFYGQKQDLKKISTPIQCRKFARFIRFAENELLFSYAFQSIPLLREIWNILNCNFFDCLISYCQSKKDEDLKLPTIIYRVYALVTVFSYTHVTFSCNNLCNEYDFSKPVELVELFQNKIHNGFDIEKIVMGRLKPTTASKMFVEELRKISLGLAETETYTFDEYKELSNFAANELSNSKLVADYPFAIIENNENTTKTESIKILFSKYQNQEVVNELLFRIDSFNSVLSLVNDKILDEQSELGLDILKSVIFDRTPNNNFYYKAIYKYINRVENCICKDDYTWAQAKRNVCFAFSETKLNGYVLASMYLFLQTSSRLVKKYVSMRNLYFDMLRLFQERMYGKITGFKFEYDFTQHENLVEKMILFLHERAINDEMSENEIEMIKALLLIAPSKCPFSRAVLNKIQKHDLQELYSNIISLYGDDECNIYNYIAQDCVLKAKKSLTSEFFEQEKFVAILGEIENIKNLGMKSSEYVLKILLSNDADSPELIETLFNNADMKDSILYKAYHGDMQEIFDGSKDICLSNSDYLILCIILKSRGLIKKYISDLENISTTILQKAMSSIFFRLADDSNIRFFSMKNNLEIWFNYVPFCESQWNKLLVIPRNENGQIWPWSEFANSSSYAAYLKIVDNAVFISIEFCSEPGSVKNNLFANAWLTDVDNFDVNSKIIRLKVIKLPFENDEEIGKAVNLALDEFSRIGNILSNVNLELEE